MSERATVSRRNLLKVAGATGALALACAPGSAPTGAGAPPAAAKPARGGSLTYAASAELTGMDPHVTANLHEIAVMRPIYEGLVRFGQDLQIQPALATSWTQAEKVWTFKLRPGVKFHDGTPFNAAAFKVSMDRINPPVATARPIRATNWVAQVEKFEVVDEMTVRFTTKVLNPYFLLLLADSSGYAISPAAIQKHGKDLQKTALGAGTGPFKFVEWIKDDRFVMVRNDDYWGDKAYLDKVTVRAVPDAAARTIAVESGDVQLMIRANPEDLERLGKNSKLAISLRPTTRHLFIGMLALKKPFSDLRVRQALNHAIDREAIVKNIYLGTAELQNHPVPPGAQGFAQVPGFKYDVAKAKQLLADAGYANGFTATLTGTKGQYLKDYEVQQALQQMLKAVNVTINIRTVEGAKYTEFIRTDPTKTDGEMWWDVGAGTDASLGIIQRYGCDRFRPVGNNTHGFCDASIDKLASEAVAIPDEARRNAQLKEAQERISLAAPSIWLVLLKEAAVMSSKVHDVFHMRDSVLTVDEHTWMEP